MKNKLVQSISAFMLLTLTSSAVMADVIFRPRASLGLTSYSLDDPDTGDSLGSSSYLNIGFGATLAFESFYLDIFTSASGDGAEHDAYDGTAFSDGTDAFERSEFIATVGTSVGESSSMFVGYRTGTSTFLSDNTPGENEFYADGLFAGMSYTIPSGESAVLSFAASGALLYGDWAQSGSPTTVADITLGFSANAQYIMFLGDTTGLSLKAGFENYAYTGFDDGSNDLSERIGSLSANLFFTF